MKIAVLADIHANLPALEAVMADLDAWQPDCVLVAGDMVNRGPQPRACVEQVLSRAAGQGWLLLKGNHEDYVLTHRDPDWPREGPAYEIRRHAHWTFEKLDGLLADLAALPDELTVPLPGGPPAPELRAVHASMLGNRRGIYPRTSDEELRRCVAPPPAIFVAGHTHRPLIRTLDETLVVNVGSVGLPFDGEWRSCYARLSHGAAGWRAALVRVPYDRGLTDRLFQETGYLAQGGSMTRIVLAELRISRSLTYDWAVSYQEEVLAGSLSLDDAITEYLAGLGLEGI